MWCSAWAYPMQAVLRSSQSFWTNYKELHGFHSILNARCLTLSWEALNCFQIYAWHSPTLIPLSFILVSYQPVNHIKPPRLSITFKQFSCHYPHCHSSVILLPITRLSIFSLPLVEILCKMVLRLPLYTCYQQSGKKRFNSSRKLTIETYIFITSFHLVSKFFAVIRDSLYASRSNKNHAKRVIILLYVILLYQLVFAE